MTDATYEHFRPVKSAGMGKLGTLGTIVLFAASLGFIVIQKFLGWTPAVVWTLFTGLFLLSAAVKDKEGLSILERLNTVAAFHWADRRGQTVYHSGPLSKLGDCTLPGVLAQTQLLEAVDSAGNPFGVILTPSVEHLAVTIECHSDATSLMDDDDRDAAVDRWGEWLSFLPNELSCVQAMVTFETSPDSGPGLQREVFTNMDPDAPTLAKQVLRDIVEVYPQDSAAVKSWVTLTFDSGKDPAKTIAALSPRLPVIVQKLSATGAGACRLVDGQGLCEITRVAFDPAAGKAIADAAALGIPRVMMRWPSVGPVSTVATWDHYRHDSAVSVTWTMTEILGKVKVGGLAPLLRPHPAIPHKRVSLIYELRDSGDSPHVAQSSVNAAQFKLDNARKPTARDRHDLKSAVITADEEASGHALLDCSVAVTGTVRDEADLPGMDAAMSSLGPSSRLLLRKENGVQPAAFVGNLAGVGLVMAEHSVVPTALRDKL